MSAVNPAGTFAFARFFAAKSGVSLGGCTGARFAILSAPVLPASPVTSAAIAQTVSPKNAASAKEEFAIKKVAHRSHARLIGKSGPSERAGRVLIKWVRT